MKKAQVWTMDFVVGMILFFVVLTVAIKLIIPLTNVNEFDRVYIDNVHLSELILNKGNPTNWNDTNVIIPGLADDNRINFTKLQYFDNLSYENTKTLFHLTNEYIFFFKNKTSILNISGLCARGHNMSYDINCNPNISSIDFSNFVKIDRIVILNSSLVTMSVYMWN